MNKSKVLAMASERFGEGVDSELLMRWICELDTIVRHEVEMTHVCEDGGEELFIDEAFQDIYLYYLQMKYDLFINDTQRYINSLSAFSSAYSDFCDRYNREHTPLGVEKISL